MFSEKADFFEFSSINEDGTAGLSTTAGGGAGKASPGDLSFTKYVDLSDGIDDLSGSMGGGGVKVPPLLLPAVQQAREAARTASETLPDEQPTIAAVGTWDDFSFG